MSEKADIWREYAAAPKNDRGEVLDAARKFLRERSKAHYDWAESALWVLDDVIEAAAAQREPSVIINP